MALIVVRPTDATLPTFNFVMIRRDKDPNLPWLEAGYEETVQARPAQINGQMVPALFVRTQTLRDRVLKLGWIDATREWRTETEAGDPTDFTDAEFSVPVVRKRINRRK